MKDPFFLLLQINDASFPIGAYAHSFALETYIREALVTDGPAAEACILQLLENSLVYSGLLLLRCAWDAAGDPGRLGELEELSFAARTPREQREASLKLGSRFVKTAAALLPGSVVFDRYRNNSGGRCSHGIAYGVFCAAAGIPREDALGAFLYAQSSAMVTVCVKTIPLSQTEGQRILSVCRGRFGKVLDKLEGLGPDDLFRSCPGLDIRSMRHEALASRLYMS
ncbi:MAG: urease accessory protein UreF [Spirochaetaceae bacterium]|jgi:urease accessory protein|nr:urease accessory protein UreF [Spirochaetaceae bacterium]